MKPQSLGALAGGWSLARCEEEWKVLFGVFALGVTLFFPLLCTMA